MRKHHFYQFFLFFLFAGLVSGCSTEGEAPDPDLGYDPNGGLLLHYDFSDGATDLSNNGNDGLIAGDPSVKRPEEAVGAALYFNETDENNGCDQLGGDYVEIPTLGEVWEKGFTIVARVQFEEVRHYERIFDMGNGLGETNGLNVTFSRLKETNDLALTSWINSDSAFNRKGGRVVAQDVIKNGQLQEFAATISPEGEMKIFVDGEKVAQRNDGHPVLNVRRERNYIGHSSYCYLDPDFKGLVDDVKIYNETLSEEEIKELFLQ